MSTIQCLNEVCTEYEIEKDGFRPEMAEFADHVCGACGGVIVPMTETDQESSEVTDADAPN